MRSPRLAAATVLAGIAISLCGLASGPAQGEEIPDSDDDSADRIANLVEQLAAADWNVREPALDELVEIGEPAVPALTAAKSSSDLEVIWRAEVALDRISRECFVASLLHASRWKEERGDFFLVDPALVGLREGSCGRSRQEYMDLAPRLQAAGAWRRGGGVGGRIAWLATAGRTVSGEARHANC